MILYRKGSPLRVRRSTAPVPPFWCATAVAPYGTKRWTPLNLDIAEMRVHHAEKVECGVADGVTDELERLSLRAPVRSPVLVDAAGGGEPVYRRGADAAKFVSREGGTSIVLVSARGSFATTEGVLYTLLAWPADVEAIERVAEEASGAAVRWGMLVPVVFHATTELPLLETLADIAARHGAAFLASTAADLDASARGAIARTLSPEDDDEQYVALFHADPEAVVTATERHVAALAAERDLPDFLVPPQWEEKTNWNAAVLLTLTATRMLAMAYETELAGTLARSARLVAGLDKPLARIAESASLSIIEPLDEVSADILTEWLETGRSTFVERVFERWRLRRDYSAGAEG